MSERKCSNCWHFGKDQNINHSYEDKEHEYICDKHEYDTLYPNSEACGSFDDMFPEDNE